MLQNPSFNACIVSHPTPLRFREFSTARWATSKSCKCCESRARSATAAGQAQTSPKGATTTRDGSAGRSAGGVKTEITRIFLCKKKKGLWKPKGFWMHLFHHHKRLEKPKTTLRLSVRHLHHPKNLPKSPLQSITKKKLFALRPTHAI